MTRNKLIHLITRVLGDNIVRDDEVIIKCPYCKHRKHKLSINIISYKWHCWVCDIKGLGLQRLFKKLNASSMDMSLLGKISNLPIFKINKNEVDKYISLPLGFIPIVSGNTIDPEFRNAFRYLQKRGLTKIDILRHNIGYCSSGTYNGYIIIPSYGEDGLLNYFVGRSYYETDFPHKNPKSSKNVIGFGMLINWDEPINICEGVFDAFAIGENTIPLFGKFLPNILNRTIIEKGVKEVNIILDKDAMRTSLKLAKELLSNNIIVNLVELPDDTDPSDLGKDKMKFLMGKSRPIDLMKMMEMQFEL